MSKDLGDFLTTYDPDGSRVVLDIDVTKGDPPQDSPFVVVRLGRYVAVLSLMDVQDHLCVDVHPFVDGKDATAGVLGMSDGRRFKLARDHVDGGPTGTTSHAWPSAGLVAVLVGEQGMVAT